MRLILFVVLPALVLSGLGLALHAMWLVAVVIVATWGLGVLARREPAGARDGTRP